MTAPLLHSMKTSVIEARALGCTLRGGTVILDDVSLAVGEGERLALIGPNGAGKTTLLRILAGMQKPDRGTVSLLGRPLAALKPAERARTAAVVGQTDQPDPRVSLWDYVGLGRIPHSGLKSRVEEWGILNTALARTGLDHLRHREMGSLSGGERQRAQIARALAQEPQVLFLDEPTNHLDPRARSDLLGLVAELGLTVVAVLHDLALVPDFATHVAVMNGGRLVAHGTPAETLSPETVRAVFAVEVLRFPHPRERRELTVFDRPVSFSRKRFQ
ncbi:ABC transporter ATP-binding protein [Mesorhizobium liriopis]